MQSFQDNRRQNGKAPTISYLGNVCGRFNITGASSEEAISSSAVTTQLSSSETSGSVAAKRKREIAAVSSAQVAAANVHRAATLAHHGSGKRARRSSQKTPVATKQEDSYDNKQRLKHFSSMVLLRRVPGSATCRDIATSLLSDLKIETFCLSLSCAGPPVQEAAHTPILTTATISSSSAATVHNSGNVRSGLGGTNEANDSCLVDLYVEFQSSVGAELGLNRSGEILKYYSTDCNEHTGDHDGTVTNAPSDHSSSNSMSAGAKKRRRKVRTVKIEVSPVGVGNRF